MGSVRGLRERRKRMRRAVVRLVPLVLVVAMVPVGLWGVAQAQAPKTLVIAIGADQTGLDPQTVENNESGFIMSTIYDSIVNYKPGSSLVGPGLAEKWEVSPDGLVYTFHLRHGVRFHDGTPMNARTVAQDVDRAINPQNPCYVLARKGVDTYDDFTYGSVKDGSVVKMDVVNDDTLRFTLPGPNAPFLSSVAMVWQGIVSPAATKQYNCDAGQHPVGTGPFKFVEAVRNDHITVDANTAYWGGRPKVDRIVFQIVPESATRMLKLERNEVQVLADVPPPDYAAKAKALLGEAGFPNGFSTNMMVYANPRGYNPIGGAKLGEAVQGYLAKVGINIKISQYEWGAYLDKLRHTAWEGFAIIGWSGDNGDPDNFLGDLFEWDTAAGQARTNNRARHHNPEFDRLIVQGRQISDQGKRAQGYEQANKILHDDAPWIFMNHTNQVRAARANVKGFQLNPLQMFFNMEKVSLE